MQYIYIYIYYIYRQLCNDYNDKLRHQIIFKKQKNICKIKNCYELYNEILTNCKARIGITSQLVVRGTSFREIPKYIKLHTNYNIILEMK